MNLYNLLSEMDQKTQIKVLRKAATLQLHAMGIVAREFTSVLIKDIKRHLNMPNQTWAQAIALANTPAKQKRIKFAENAHVVLSKIGRHMCSVPVLDGFANMVVTGALRDDTSIIVGFGLKSIGNNFNYRPTAIIAWGVSDSSDTADIKDARGQVLEEDVGVEILLETQNAADRLNSLVRRNKVVEIDLTCAAKNNENNMWQTHGSGRALLAGGLAKIASRTRGGERKFDAIVTYVAFAEGGVPPLKSALLSMGFKSIRSWFSRPGVRNIPSQRSYFVLIDSGGVNWERKVARSIAWSEDIAKMCPLTPGTGKTYCS